MAGRAGPGELAQSCLICPQGDSGGPLLCNNEIQGIVSYGRRNGASPRACTKVSRFLPWIKKTMKGC